MIGPQGAILRHCAFAFAIVGAATAAAAQDAPQAVVTPAQPQPGVPDLGPRKPCAHGCLTPAETIAFANELAPRAGVAGEFVMTVKAVGEDRGIVYLNSEDDYRDQRNLSIDLPPNVANSFAPDGLSALRTYFVGRRIAVAGVAARQRIDFTTNDQPTGKYYYQTHVRLRWPEQIVDAPDQTSSTNRP